MLSLLSFRSKRQKVEKLVHSCMRFLIGASGNPYYLAKNSKKIATLKPSYQHHRPETRCVRECLVKGLRKHNVIRSKDPRYDPKLELRDLKKTLTKNLNSNELRRGHSRRNSNATAGPSSPSRTRRSLSGPEAVNPMRSKLVRRS